MILKSITVEASSPDQIKRIAQNKAPRPAKSYTYSLETGNITFFNTKIEGLNQLPAPAKRN